MSRGQGIKCGLLPLRQRLRIAAAGFMMLLTSLSAASATAEDVVRLYRMRWQVELAFKRLKSLGGFDALRADDPRLARSWLLAHLIAAVLIETSLGEGLDLPPPRDPGSAAARPAEFVAGPEMRPPPPAIGAVRSVPHDARRQPSAAPHEYALPSHRESARAKQARLKLPYPSAYGAKSLTLSTPTTAPARRRFRPGLRGLGGGAWFCEPDGMAQDPDIVSFARMLGNARRIVLFTGAGISTELGISDFRSPGGLWTKQVPSTSPTSCVRRRRGGRPGGGVSRWSRSCVRRNPIAAIVRWRN